VLGPAELAYLDRRDFRPVEDSEVVDEVALAGVDAATLGAVLDARPVLANAVAAGAVNPRRR
jgi:hypothetical protein